MKQKTLLQIPDLMGLSTSPLTPGFYEHIFKVYETELKDKKFYFYNILNKVQLPELNPDFFTEYKSSVRMPFTTFANTIYNTSKEINNTFVLWWLIKIFNPDKASKFYVDPGDTYIVLKPEFVPQVLGAITQNG